MYFTLVHYIILPILRRIFVMKRRNGSRRIEVCVSKKDAKVWLAMNPNYEAGTEFLEILAKAVKKKSGTFTVPIGYVEIDDSDTVVFSENYGGAVLGPVTKYAKEIATKNGLVWGDKYDFVLFVTSIMNEVLKSGADPTSVFQAATAMYDDITDHAAVRRIRENYPLLTWANEVILSDSNRKSRVLVSMPWQLEEHPERKTNYIGRTFFFIKK